MQPEYEPNKLDEKVKQHKNKTNNKSATKNIEKSQNQKNTVSKTELKKKSSFIFYIVFGFTVLFTISYRNSIINERFNEKQSLKAELTEIQKINEQLEVSVENELNLTSIEKMAKEKLGMSKLSNNQKVYVSLPKKEYIESSTEKIIIEEEQNIFQKAYKSIKEFF